MTTMVEEARAALAAAQARDRDRRIDPQPCMLCQKPDSPFGFGLPPRPTVWACSGHRAAVAALWKPSPYAPMPRGKAPPRVTTSRAYSGRRRK